MGLCGDDCPKLCRKCRPDEIQIFLGTEDEENALFVKIDCGHIIEVSGMD